MASIEPQSDVPIPLTDVIIPTDDSATTTAILSVQETTTVTDSITDEKEKELAEIKANWPGWPGYSVFRIIVPVLKVGGIIGRKGDLIKKLVEETKAKIRVLDGPNTSPDRVVVISGKEEPDAVLSPAMDAILRVFKRVNGLPEDGGDATAPGAAVTAFCSIRLLVAQTQAISLIGKQGSVIKSIQESTGASVRVLGHEELPLYATSEERVVELQGEALKVLKALEAVVGHLRKFLVDHSILPFFEKNYNTPAPAVQEQSAPWSEKTSMHSTQQTSLASDYSLPVKRDSLFLGRESQIESHIPSSSLFLGRESQIESHIPSSRLSLYGSSEHGLGSLASTVGRPGGPFVTQVAQTMQIPLAFAEDIIGVQGANIDFIRRSSGAILTVQESRGLPEEITVEIKGTSSQVQAAQQLIQEFTSGHREPQPGSYGQLESSLRSSSYSQSPGGTTSSYLSSYASGQLPYGRAGGYGSSGLGGGYGSFRP